jgi:hypothetical protein
MKIELKSGLTEVTRGDYLKAYFEGFGHGLARIEDIRLNQIKVHWMRNDWALNLEDDWMSVNHWEHWELDETSVVERLLAEYQA